MKSFVSKIKHRVFSSDLFIPPAEKVVPYVYSIAGIAFVFGIITTVTNLKKTPSNPKENTSRVIPNNQEKTIAESNELPSIVKRNLFNISGVIPDAENNGILVCPEIPIKSDLPYKISGIIFGGTSEASMVVFENNGGQDKQSNSFKTGEMLPLGGRLTGIEKNRILVTNKNCPEFIDLIYPTPPKSRESKLAQGSSGASYKENGFERIGNSTTATKQWVNNILNNNFAKTLEEAKASPNLVGGQVKGFVLSHITPNSVYSKLGLQNGDVIDSINNIQLNDAARAIQTLNSMKNENSIELQVIRNGKPTIIRVNIQ